MRIAVASRTRTMCILMTWCQLASDFIPAPRGPVEELAAAERSVSRIVPLSFRDILDPSPAELKLSSTMLGLDGKRVRIRGFMARMESPQDGAFYLCSRPVVCDESGAGTADLPPDTVRIIVPSPTGKQIPFIAGLLEVTGILRIGNQTDSDNVSSSLRIVTDRASVTVVRRPPPSR
jgi:hypothetical protein